MSTELQHDEIESLLGAYALDAVEPDEAMLVERHLEECPRCGAEVDAFRELAGRLGTSAVLEDAEPVPPELWDRIAERLNAAPRRSPSPMPDLVRPESATAVAGAGVVEISSARRGRQRSDGGWRSPRTMRWMSLAVAAAAVVAIALLGLNLSQANHQLGQARSALDSRGPNAAVEAALANPRHRLVRLDSSEGTQLAELVMVPNGQGYMVSSSMPQLPSDETYQLWAMISGQPISLGLLGNQPRRAAFTVASTAAPTELAVTIEPAGGVATPNRSPVATGDIVSA
jgi:anti-sigma-K factor RskA